MKKLNLLSLLMNRSIFVKYFFSMAVVSSLGIFAVVATYQHFFEKMLIEVETSSIQRSIDQTSVALDSKLDQIVKDMFHFISYSKNGTELLRAQVSDVESTEDMRRAADMLGAFRYRYPGDVDSVFFYREDGRIFYDYGLSLDKQTNFMNMEWYSKFVEHSREIWSYPSSSRMFNQDAEGESLWLSMGMYDVESQDGILVSRLNPNLFRNMFSRLENDDLRIRLMTPLGESLYQSDQGLQPFGESVFIHAELEQSGFRIEAEVRKDYIIRRVDAVQQVNLPIIGAVLLASLLISLILSLTLVKPVRKLLRLMKHVERGDFTVRFPIRFTDEIGLLAVGFNQMVHRVSDLIQQVYVIRMEKMEMELVQKEATLKALQSQINPHFLYNTLEAINCHAIVRNVPSISKMSKSLADFFRYAIEKQEIVVPLFKESHHLDTYILIQGERYPEIEIEVDIPEELYPCPIVKLTLQPIVENCFIHGFKKARPYWIYIGAKQEDGDCLIVIEDNGEGMEESEIVRFNRLLKQSDGSGHQGGGGIGLWNVNHRLRLQFGEAYGLHVSSSVHGGIRVEVRIPFQQ
ncbi:sensor histidine kinase [Paenibacillus chungangensis]|uniref:Sensor histidine kinase n=1 Tax=Paenibacillus chungangensis TaxID=696535 RepID=A0ABW3HKN0_9BACL